MPSSNDTVEQMYCTRLHCKCHVPAERLFQSLERGQPLFVTYVVFASGQIVDAGHG